MRRDLLSPAEFLKLPEARLLDVRAEGEFASGHIPGSVNVPILRDEERHLVGTCYKQEGPEQAIALGHQLVDPHRAERVAAWREALRNQSPPVLTCFRGGLRSQISQQWLEESGFPALRIDGGYKALRRALLEALAMPWPGFVVTGLAGAAKTGFLKSVPSPRVVDLEEIGRHRGSAFGGLFQKEAQPAQQTFENAIALQLIRGSETGRDFLFEDESRLVGTCVIPSPFFETLQGLPRIFLEVPFEERISNVVRDYVDEPLSAFPKEQVAEGLLGKLQTLRARLGGLALSEIEDILRRAFAAPAKEEQDSLHRLWISRLLRDYYDRLYTHSIERCKAPMAFRGPAEECRAFLRKNSDLFA